MLFNEPSRLTKLLLINFKYDFFRAGLKRFGGTMCRYFLLRSGRMPSFCLTATKHLRNRCRKQAAYRRQILKNCTNIFDLSRVRT